MIFFYVPNNLPFFEVCFAWDCSNWHSFLLVNISLRFLTTYWSAGIAGVYHQVWLSMIVFPFKGCCMLVVSFRTFRLILVCFQRALYHCLASVDALQQYVPFLPFHLGPFPLLKTLPLLTLWPDHTYYINYVFKNVSCVLSLLPSLCRLSLSIYYFPFFWVLVFLVNQV